LGVHFPEGSTAGDGQVMVYNGAGGNLYFADAFDGSAIQVTGGAIDGTDIGANTPAAGTFTTLNATNGIDSTVIGANTPAAATFTTLSATTGIDNTAIGANNPAAATFTTLVSNAGLNVQSSANLLGIMQPSVDGSANQILTTQGNGHLNFVSANVILQNTSVSNLSVSSFSSSSISATGGSLDGVVIGNSTPASATFTTIDGDSLTLGDNLSVADNLSTAKLTVSDDGLIGNSTADSFTINSTIKGGALGGNVWFQGNLISATNTYSLGIASKPWSAIYAIRLVTTSDHRAKKDVDAIGYGLEEVMKLNPVSYKWKEQPNPKKTLGLIAQEVNEVIEEVVVDERQKGGRLGIEYHTLVPVLIQAIKDQQKIINAQKDQIDGQSEIARDQERRLNRLERLFSEASQD
jgi:hypothetical protein